MTVLIMAIAGAAILVAAAACIVALEYLHRAEASEAEIARTRRTLHALGWDDPTKPLDQVVEDVIVALTGDLQRAARASYSGTEFLRSLGRPFDDC